MTKCYDVMRNNEIADKAIKPNYYKGKKICPNCKKEIEFDLIDLSLSTRLEGTALMAIRYVLRHESKNGLEDLNKAKECVERLIQDKKNRLEKEGRLRQSEVDFVA